MAESKAVQKFKEKLETLEKDTALGFDIIPDLEEHIKANRLYTGWFAPGTVLATAKDEKGNVIKYEVEGDLDATLLSPSGDTVHTFSGKFTIYETGDILIANDKDIDALKDGTHESGHTLLINTNNKVKVSVEGNSDISPVTPEDLSVARNILNVDLANELKEAIFNYVKPEDKLPDKKINDRLDALADAATKLDELAFDELPERPLTPEEAEDERITPFEVDIPVVPDEEDEEIEDLPEPAKKEEKKTAKKASSSKTKQTKAKKSSASKTKKDEAKEAIASDEEDVPRFDLLPLDIVKAFIDKFDEDCEDVDFLYMIERYKAEECSLLEAAVMYAKANYESAADAVTTLAKEFEADAEANGEDAWKEKDALRYINEAIQDHLFSGSDEEDRKNATLRRLVCAAWIDTNA